MTDPHDLALPIGCTDLLSELKHRVKTARTTALRTVNTQLIELNWSIGNDVRTQQEGRAGGQSWGAE
ncbi:hypothetical protein QK290_17880 [Pseudarthrobacter sp. AL07]|uniref:hypothetical protein n=1 Tax=unclassified Pseudarthrobacter TaxID=2647000 RepID=UPI00249C74D0|nr:MULTISPECIES: hypothetical protein [unclassified Pseudarthrobacter]MDI3196266.1 hypothetical protein [Pseudarthrobacter sp. AL20]MDI3210325.1 hypothetical protein [Pseudarthrobacter sp. AL07]